VSVSATWRYLGAVKIDNNDPNPLLLGSTMGAPVIYRANMPAMNYIDLSASWDVSKHLQLRGGINNVFDKDPPLAPFQIVSGGAPNYYEFYDGLGRQLYLAMTAKF